MKKVLILLLVFLLPAFAEAKCVSGNAYVLKAYFESATTPGVGMTLSNVLFDIFYDDGTSSLGNTATAEMGQGWYRYAYTANGKNGVWVGRDNTATYKNFPGGMLEGLCDSQDAAAKEILDRVRRVR